LSTKTPNINLVKPLGTENYDIAVVNANSDIIDTEITDAKAGSATRVFKAKNDTSSNTNVLNVAGGDGRYLGKTVSAVSAVKLKTARNIQIEGDVTTVTKAFDGTKNITFNLVVNDSKKLNGKAVINSVTSTDMYAPASASAVKKAYDEAISSGISGGLGYSQHWHNQKAHRAINIKYTNNTSKPILISIGFRSGDNQYCSLFVDAVEIGRAGEYGVSGYTTDTLSGIVPIGAEYELKTSGSASKVDIDVWAELS